MSQQTDDLDTKQPDLHLKKQTDILKNKNTVQGKENSTVQGNENQAVLGNSNTVFYGNNNQIQFVFSNTQNLPQQNPERKIPPLLPYLVNRSKQEYELEKGIKQLIKQATVFPCICIIYGDEFQSHEKFLERLYKVSLPKFLEQDSIKRYHLPSPPKFNNFNELSDYLHHQLADIVVKSRYASLEEINGCFNECPIPILIHTHILIEKWRKQEFETLHNLLNFWQLWPDGINQKLIICIVIKYKIRRKKYTKNLSIINLFLEFINYFFQEYLYQRSNQKFSQYIKRLLLSNVEQLNRLSLLVLPELTGVNRGEVEDWVRMEYTQNFIGEAMADKLIKEIRELFDKWEEQNSSNIIPMDDLADRLINLLKSSLSDEE